MLLKLFYTDYVTQVPFLSALCVTFYRILKLEDAARACESVVSSKYLG